jgi:mannosyl-3-phosphoglycerate phosphatase
MIMKAKRQLIIYTDLDGALLDHHTYSAEAALPALRAAQRRGVPIVFCSSKTRAEIEALQQQLDVHHPFIVENGGAIFIPIGYFPFELEKTERRGAYQVIELGASYEKLVTSLRLLRANLPHRLAGFSDLTAEEVAEVCELPLDEARRAKMREYDEPFRLLDPTPDAGLAVQQQIDQAGLHCSVGGRFWHLHGNNDKGLAVKLLSTFYRRAFGRIFTIGLGDSMNDAPLLEAVDWPVLVQRPNGAFAEGLTQRIPRLNLAQARGPRGWCIAVMHVLNRIYTDDVRADYHAANGDALKSQA